MPVMYDVDSHSINSIMEKLSERLKNISYQWEGKIQKVSISIGISFFPYDAGDPSGLISCADTAMSRSKEDCRTSTTWSLYNKMYGDRNYLNKLLNWKSKIEYALSDERFFLLYQPILSVTENKVLHCEGLMRMRDEYGNVLTPDDFILIAEDIGIISLIDRRGIDIALMHMSELLIIGLIPRGALNISPKTLQEESLFDFLDQRLVASNVPGELVTLEITESSPILDPDLIIERMKKIRKLGCKFSIDDFGSGYSTWLNLRKLPIDYLKIDGTFIQQLSKEPKDSIFIKAINEISHALNIKTVAECVENEEVFEVIKNIGVDFIQGYFISKPLKRLSNIFTL